MEDKNEEQWELQVRLHRIGGGPDATATTPISGTDVRSGSRYVDERFGLAMLCAVLNRVTETPAKSEERIRRWSAAAWQHPGGKGMTKLDESREAGTNRAVCPKCEHDLTACRYCYTERENLVCGHCLHQWTKPGGMTKLEELGKAVRDAIAEQDAAAAECKRLGVLSKAAVERKMDAIGRVMGAEEELVKHARTEPPTTPSYIPYTRKDGERPPIAPDPSHDPGRVVRLA